jgi:hypothetical protein
VDEHERDGSPTIEQAYCRGFRSMALVKLGTFSLGPPFRVRAFACECLHGSPAVAYGRRYFEERLEFLGETPERYHDDMPFFDR